jgi:PTS system galactitol-specific IIA component
MKDMQLFVRDNIFFEDHFQALKHIGDAMLNAGVVKNTYPQALLDREKDYPTGIALEGYSIAIPHCSADNAITPAIYLIRPNAPVPFDQADDTGIVNAQLIIALIVTDPKDQLVLLKNLFTNIQNPEFFYALLNAEDEETLVSTFKNRIFNQEGVCHEA